MNFGIDNSWDGSIIPTTFDDICGFVPEGWRVLLESGFQQMFDNGWDGNIVQIKEKFGSLRLYIDNSNDDIDMIIDEMEEQSSKICSVCGSKRTKSSKGWFMFYCDEHFPEGTSIFKEYED